MTSHELQDLLKPLGNVAGVLCNVLPNLAVLWLTQNAF